MNLRETKRATLKAALRAMPEGEAEEFIILYGNPDHPAWQPPIVDQCFIPWGLPTHMLELLNRVGASSR